MPLSSQPSGSTSRATSVPFHHVLLTMKDMGQPTDVQQCDCTSSPADCSIQGSAARVGRALAPTLECLQTSDVHRMGAPQPSLRVPRTNGLATRTSDAMTSTGHYSGSTQPSDRRDISESRWL